MGKFFINILIYYVGQKKLFFHVSAFPLLCQFTYACLLMWKSNVSRKYKYLWVKQITEELKLKFSVGKLLEVTLKLKETNSKL